MKQCFYFTSLLCSFFLFCTTVGMNKQMNLYKELKQSNSDQQQHPDLNPISIHKLTQYRDQRKKRIANFVKWTWLIKLGTGLILPTCLETLGLPSSDEKQEKESVPKKGQLRQEKNRLEQELNEKKRNVGLWDWILHYVTKVASALTGGFVHWQIGCQTDKLIETETQNSFRTFGISVCGQSEPIVVAALYILPEHNVTDYIKAMLPAPKNPSLKTLANPLRLAQPIPLITQLAISAIQACEKSCKEYMDDKVEGISPNLILKRTCLLFTQKKLRAYFVPLATGAIAKLGPEVTKEIRQAEHELAKVKQKLKKH